MAMKHAILAAALVLMPLPAAAYENFIPLGHNYSPDEPVLPPLNSTQDDVNAQVDIFEADIYTRQRAAKQFQSRLDQFYNNQELEGADTFIDY